VWSASHTSTSFQVPVNQWSGSNTTPTIVNNSYTISNWATDPAAQSQAYLTSPSGVVAPHVYEIYRNGLLEAEAAGKFRSGYFDWLAWQGGTAKDVNGNVLAAYETADPALNQTTVLTQLNSGQGVSLAGFQQLKTLLDTLVELLAQPKSFRDLVARAQGQTHADLMSVLEKLGVVADQRTLSRDAISRLASALDVLNPANVDPALIPAPDAHAFESDKNLSLEAFQHANDPLQAHLRLLEEAQALMTRFAQRSLPDQLDSASQLSADIRAFVSRNRDSLDDTLATQLETFASIGLPGARASFDAVQGPSYVPHLTFIHQARIRAAAVVENLDSSLRSLDLLHGTMSAIQPKPTASLTKLEALITRLKEQRAEFASAQRVANELLAVVPASATLVTLRGDTLAQYQAVVKRLQQETGQDDLMSFLHDHSVPPASLTDNTYRATFTDANAGVNPPTYFSPAGRRRHQPVAGRNLGGGPVHGHGRHGPASCIAVRRGAGGHRPRVGQRRLDDSRGPGRQCGERTEGPVGRSACALAAEHHRSGRPAGCPSIGDGAWRPAGVLVPLGSFTEYAERHARGRCESLRAHDRVPAWAG
jgi:hypothetical protein